MTDIVEIFQFGSYASLALSVILIIVSVILFFKFKIRDAIYELSGKARVTSTKKMQSSYCVTGSLRSGSVTGSGSLNSSETSKSDDLNRSLMMTDTLRGKTQSGGRQDLKKHGNTANVKKSSQLTGSKKLEHGIYKLTKDVVVIHTEERITQ